ARRRLRVDQRHGRPAACRPLRRLERPRPRRRRRPLGHRRVPPPQERARVAAMTALAIELDFSQETLAFLTAQAPRRRPEEVVWGQGDENLALFHETTGDEEAHEVAV